MKLFAPICVLYGMVILVASSEDAPKPETSETPRDKRNLEYTVSHNYPVGSSFRLERRISTGSGTANAQIQNRISYPATFYPTPRTHGGPIRRSRPNKVPSYAVQMEPLVQYSQRDPLYESQKHLQHVVEVSESNALTAENKISAKNDDLITENNYISEHSYLPAPISLEHYGVPHHGHVQNDPEPIIEIIIKESNESLPPAPTPLPQPRKKEPVQVFYVKYKKDPHGGKDSVVYETPIPAITPPTNNHDEHEEIVTAAPELVTYGPPAPSTTLRTIIRPDSEVYHTDSGVHVTFGTENKYHHEKSSSGPENHEESAPLPALAYPNLSPARSPIIFPHSSVHKRQPIQSQPPFDGPPTPQTTKSHQPSFQNPPQPYYRPFAQPPPSQYSTIQHSVAASAPSPAEFGRSQNQFRGPIPSQGPPPSQFIQRPPFHPPHNKPQTLQQQFQHNKPTPPPFTQPLPHVHQRLPFNVGPSQQPSFQQPPQFNYQPQPQPSAYQTIQLDQTKPRPTPQNIKPTQSHFPAPPQNSPPFKQNQRPQTLLQYPPQFQQLPQQSFSQNLYHQQSPPSANQFGQIPNGPFQHKQHLRQQPLNQLQQQQQQPLNQLQQQHQHHQQQQQHHHQHQHQHQQQPQHQPQQQQQQAQHQQQQNPGFQHQQNQFHQQQQNQFDTQHQNQFNSHQHQFNQQQNQLHQQHQFQQAQQHAQHVIPPGGELIKSVPKFEQHISITVPKTQTNPQQYQFQQASQQQQGPLSHINLPPTSVKQNTLDLSQKTAKQELEISAQNQQFYAQQAQQRTPEYTTEASQEVSTYRPSQFPFPQYSTTQPQPPTTAKPVEPTPANKTSPRPSKPLDFELPDEVPDDLRQQLLSSGILNNADISVLDYDKIGDIPIESLPPDQLANFYGAGGAQQIAGSAPIPAVLTTRGGPPTAEMLVDDRDQIYDGSDLDPVLAAPPANVHMKVVHFDPNSQQGQAVPDKYVREDATEVDPVVLNDSKYNKYLPLKVSGAQFPIPDVPELKGRNVTSVVVLAPIDYNYTNQHTGERFERDVTSDVHFVAGAALKELIRNPTADNYKKWLDKEKNTDSDKQSVVLLVTGSDQEANKEIFMYDITSQTVSKLSGELSTAFVEAAESNASGKDVGVFNTNESNSNKVQQPAQRRSDGEVEYAGEDLTDAASEFTSSVFTDNLATSDRNAGREVSVSSGYSKTGTWGRRQ